MQRSTSTKRNIPTDKCTTPGRPSIPNRGCEGRHYERAVSTLSRQNQCDLKPPTSPLLSISSTPFARARSSRARSVCFRHIHAAIARTEIWRRRAWKNAEINVFDFQFTKFVGDPFHGCTISPSARLSWFYIII